MKKIIKIGITCLSISLFGCEPYDTYKDELSVEFNGSAVAFSTATTSPDSVKENSVPISLTVEMPYAIQTSRGVQVNYEFGGDATFGTDFTAKAIESNNPNSQDVVEKFADASGGSFIIKNKEKSEDADGEQSYTNVKNTATIEVSPLVVYGVDKTGGKVLDVILTSATNLDDNSDVTVGQGGIKGTYNMVLEDIHCPTSLDGTYSATIETEEGLEAAPDVIITTVDSLANPDNIWGLYDISNIAGDIQDIPFQIIDQCGEFLGPSDSYITISGDTNEAGRIELDVMFSDGTTTRQWILYLTKQ
ncbi:hypothetical protein [Flammeovirga sp. SubArs3]|uniref:hypothetical protein n=1 Tax=Flammeovirga sp. SubArs3 TaxID=2995316 RepID=UPI00248AA2FD|nr:hypothetical protein [Flammeovirga sp. SubArs3]